MSVAFYRGKQLGAEDLNIFLEDGNGRPADAAEITYGVYDFTTGSEVLVGPPRRQPQHPQVGSYYASLVIPTTANLGAYRVRWTFREQVGGPLNQVVQEFEVVDQVTAPLYSTTEQDFLRRMRLRLRDSDPDRNYRFRPPAHENTINQFNKVFGAIWTDEELSDFLTAGLDMVAAAPPYTGFANVDQLMQSYPAWRTLVLNGAMMQALFALQLNWISEEFSLDCNTQLVVRTPVCGVVTLTIGDLYRQVTEAGSPFQAALEAGTLEVQSVQQDGTVTWSTCTAVLKHSTGHKRAFQVTTENGSVITTEDHSLFAWNPEGGLVEIAPRDMQVGDRLVQVVDGAVAPCTVLALTEVAPLEESYDLSVPGPQNFVLANGLLAHNSYSIGGVSLDLEKSSKYQSAYDTLKGTFDEQLERAKQTVKIIRGLQQPKYGMGIRSAFGPHTSAGSLTPRKFIGF